MVRTPPPLKNHRNIGLSNSGPDPLKKHKATKPALNVGPLAFRWRADVGPHIVVFGSFLLSTTRKKTSKLDPSGKTFWIRACEDNFFEATT